MELESTVSSEWQPVLVAEVPVPTTTVMIYQVVLLRKKCLFFDGAPGLWAFGDLPFFSISTACTSLSDWNLSLLGYFLNNVRELRTMMWPQVPNIGLYLVPVIVGNIAIYFHCCSYFPVQGW